MGHSHHHHAPSARNLAHRKRLAVVLALYLGIISAEIVGSLLTDSLALLAEALHMAIDASGILISLLALFVSARGASRRHTFGLGRVEIVAVLLNCLLLFTLGAFILYEAITRWFAPPRVDGRGVIVFALVGVVCSAISLLVLRAGAKESLNVRAAFLEVLSDGVGSLAIIVSGLLDWLWGWHWADILAAGAIGVIILPRAFVLFKQALHIVLQGVPEGIDVSELQRQIEAHPEVCAVHCLHVWSLTSGVVTMSAHVVVNEPAYTQGRASQVLDDVTALVRENFGLEHVTLQIEEPGHWRHEANLHASLARKRH